MNRSQIGQMLEKVSAVYPNTYRGMDERQRARIIDEWYRSLEKYPVQICQRAWEKYRDMMKLRELNIAIFIGIIKDLQEADRREQEKVALPVPEEPVRDEEWERARAEFMQKCKSTFGRAI